MQHVVKWLSISLFLFGCSADEPSSQGTDAVAEPSAAGEDTAAAVTDVAAAPAAHPGKDIYDNYCFSCHTTGLSGAPRLGDVEAWAPRIAKGSELLLQSTIEGIPPAMPARGICFECDDEQLAAAVDYMVVESQ
ncbi:MAG: c-type cytochrome [Pseudomonadota bacterium]